MEEFKMKRRVMKLDEIRNISSYFQETHDMSAGVWALVDLENMAFCKDGVTRFDMFNDENGNPAIYFKD